MTPEILIRLAGVGEFLLSLVFKAFAAYLVYEGTIALTMSSKVGFYFGAAVFVILVAMSLDKKKDAGIASIAEVFEDFQFPEMEDDEEDEEDE
jgi:hypothetical protein